MRFLANEDAVGIIPAYAGSTACRCSLRVGCRDHPRIRGEHARVDPQRELAEGSSPHTRGAPDLRHKRRVDGGIIPAYAGSTATKAKNMPSRRDHPRIRGEHDTPLTNVTPFTGSSPHTRGAHRHRPARRHRSRIIPAYAGSTRRRSRRPTVSADHPRIRGEHLNRPVMAPLAPGSSPHTRGARK